VFTSVGVFKALGLVPRMEKTQPIGMFRRGSTVKVWIETDDERIFPCVFRSVSGWHRHATLWIISHQNSLALTFRKRLSHQFYFMKATIKTQGSSSPLRRAIFSL